MYTQWGRAYWTELVYTTKIIHFIVNKNVKLNMK